MKKYSVYIIVGLALVGFFLLLEKLIGGAIALVGGALNTVIALAVIAALIVIVVWMFVYARRSRK